MTDSEYAFVLKEEGGYVNDPADSGGATNRGVTQETYDGYRKEKKLPTRSVRYCTKPETRDIYEGFFLGCAADHLPPGLALFHFDFAINAGTYRANKTLQQTLNIKDDGVIGPQTLAAVASSNIEDLIVSYAEHRRMFYRGLAERRPKDMKFLKGWLLRTNRAEREAIKAYRNGILKSV